MRNRFACVAIAALLAVGCGDDDVSGPVAGVEGGPCYPNDTCNEPWMCLSDICVEPPPCTSGDTRLCTCNDGLDGTQTCDASETWNECYCVLECEPGTANCDGDTSNGCETALGTVDNCDDCSSVPVVVPGLQVAIL